MSLNQMSKSIQKSKRGNQNLQEDCRITPNKTREWLISMAVASGDKGNNQSEKGFNFDRLRLEIW